MDIARQEYPNSEESEDETHERELSPRRDASKATTNGSATSPVTNGVAALSIEGDGMPTIDERFQALVRDREALREEVTQLRQSLEQLQAKHEADVVTLQEQVHDVTGEKNNAEEQYQNLLGKVNTIRSQLGERLKADAVSPPRALMSKFC